ncbi:MAG: hypothetical protein IPL23_00010 [Saprospiraceae bacterium]|nr:hypothetical protein [Saprospiraceae bacterium]
MVHSTRSVKGFFFENADFLVALDGELWTIEGGSLYRSNVKSLVWERVGKGRRIGPIPSNGRLEWQTLHH